MSGLFWYNRNGDGNAENGIEQRQAIELLCTDMPVPKDHLLRKIDAAVDFTRIYDFVEDLYCVRIMAARAVILWSYLSWI